MERKYTGVLKHEKQQRGYEQYHSYSPSQSPKESVVVKQIERDMALAEYEDDRDLILNTLKTAIKEGNYDEARDIVYQYRAAIPKDEQLAVLADMVREEMEKSSQISRFVTMLDATPDDAYKKRIELCKEILKVQPDNARYKDEMHRCQQAIGIHVPASQRTPKNDDAPKGLIANPVIMGIFGGFNGLVMLGSIVPPVDGRMFASFFVITFIQAFICSNLKFNPFKNSGAVGKFFLCLFAFLVACVLAVE